MIDLSKYTGEDKSEIFHTSGHARLARGDQIGSAGTQSFQQRLDLAASNRTVADYKKSVLGARRGIARAKKATPESTHLKRTGDDTSGNETPRFSRQAFNAGEQPSSPSAKPSTSFREPPSRGYNPYA